MKSSNMSSSEKGSAFKGEHDGIIKNQNEMYERIMYMPTLPSTFKSLAGKAVKLEREEPRYVIELLGDLLGVTDYKTNKAAFWFLDTVALQVLHYKNCLDDRYRSVLISWLAGEMKLIRDRKLLREDFFKIIRALFLYATEKLFSGNQLLHWELLVDECSEITPKNLTVHGSAKNSAKYLATNKSSEEELIAEDNEHASRGNKLSFTEKNFSNYNYGSVTNNLRKKSSKNFQIPLITENLQTDTFTNKDANATIESSDLMNPRIVLDIIAEATYSMYANELRYALIRAVFVTPIQMQIYHMPHALRIPRQIKLADPEKEPFNMQLRQRLEKTASELATGERNDKKHKGKKRINNMNKGREGMIAEDLNLETPLTPASSLLEEEILVNNRRFILPLMEAKEVLQVIEMHTGNT